MPTAASITAHLNLNTSQWDAGVRSVSGSLNANLKQAEEFQSIWIKNSGTINSNLEGLVTMKRTLATTEPVLTSMQQSFAEMRRDSAATSQSVAGLGENGPAVSVRPVLSIGPNLGAGMAPVPVRVTPQIGRSNEALAFAKTISKSMAGLNTSLARVRKSVNGNRTAISTWRQAMQADKVDQSFNVAANGIQSAGGVIAGTLATIRKSADAMISDPGVAATAMRDNAGAVSSELQETANTMAKWVVAAKDMKPIIQGMGFDFDALEAKLGNAQSGIQDAATAASIGVSKLSAATAAATGNFENAEGSSTLANYVEKEVTRPARIATRAVLSLKKSKDVLRKAVTTVAAPMMRAADLYRENAQAVRLFRERVNQLDGAARKKAIRLHHLNSVMRPLLVTMKILLSPAKMLAKVAFRGIAKAASSLITKVRQSGRSLKRMATDIRTPYRAAKAFVGGLKASVKQLARVGKAAKTAGRLARKAIPGAGPGNSFGSGISGATQKLSALRTGLLAMAVVAGGWGVASAASTETAQVQFGTFLQDIDQGKALVAEITKFSAATPFSNDSLRESTALLLNSEIAADKITGKLTQLGDIAAGVNKPIEEIAATYQKLAAKPKIGLGELNQLAEKGVPIYRELETVTGKSRAELFKMISAGQVGLPQVNQALSNLTTGTGIFAGGMAKQSQTLAGLFSTLKDNVGILFETISGAFLKIFNVKGLMASFTSFVQFLSGQVQRITAIVAVVQEVFSGVFAAIAEIGSSVFTMLFGAGASTFNDLLESFTVFGALVAWGFSQWPNLAGVAFKSIALFGLSAFNDLAFFFTDQMPAYLSWFASNWKEIFTDAANVVATVFGNIGKNIVDAMTAIWDFIASGGTKSLALSWTPLLDGFESTLSELPSIPERSLSALEQTMTADLDRMKGNLSESMGDAVTASLDRLQSTLAEKNEPIKLAAVAGEQVRSSNDAAAGKEATKRDSFVAGNFQQGSADALKAIFGAQAKDKTPEQSLSVQKQTLAEIKKGNKTGPLKIGVAQGIA